MTSRISRRRVGAIAAAGALAVFGGCGEEDVEDAGDDAQQEAEDAGEDVQQEAEDAGDEGEQEGED
jgi:hypothetical protein